MDKLLVIGGPTGVGKTRVSLKVAKDLDGEIVSGDSMQIYKYMDIGTAKATEHDRQCIPHHLIDVLEPDEKCSAYQYQLLAKNSINDIRNRNKLPIIVGGTGFYIRTVIYNTEFTDRYIDEEYKSMLSKMVDTYGNEHIHDMLKLVDPNSALAIHPNNIKRVINALEYNHSTKMLLSEHNLQEHNKSSAYEHKYYVLFDNRETLYKRIDSRVDAMIDKGLLYEVKELLLKGYNKKMTSMQGIGYKELIAYLEGEYDIATAIELIKKGSRNYAKRQLTWYRREDNIIWIDISDYEYNLDRVANYIVRDYNNAKEQLIHE